MPDTTRPTDRVRVLSVRLTNEELEALTARATEVGVGPSTLARTLVRSALALGAPESTNAPVPASAPSRSGSTPAAAHTAQPSALEAQLLLGLAARIEALERWVAEH